MKITKMRQVLAAAMSTAMVMGMPMAAFAEDDPAPAATPVPTSSSVDVDAPIYSFDKINVVVPSALVVAFNPDKLGVDVGGTDLSTDQVLSKNFGILNKSNKDKIVTVTLKVEDLNEGQITFVEDKADVADPTKVKEGDYAIYLAAVPADTTQVKVGDGTADADIGTDGAAMGSVTMTGAAAQAQTLAAGNNTMAFVLKKAGYEPKNSGGIVLGTSEDNAVGDNMELKSVDKEKGITAFTFTGELNEKADWSKLTKAIRITAVYNFETTYDYDTLTGTGGSIVTGTGAMLSEAAPKFSTGGVGTINFAAGIGNKAFAGIVSISAPWEGSPYDVTSYATVDTKNGTITIDSSILAGWASNRENPTATIVYKNAADDEVTTTVTLTTH